MKNLFKSYSTFTRTERIGIFALLLIIGLLLAIRFTMHLWVRPAPVDISRISLPGKKNGKQHPPVKQAITIVPPVKLNINTVDSLTLVSLPGIGKGISHRILQRRRQLGKFTSMEQVFEVYHFKQETREMLQKYTVVE